jgi:hypothetical protein
MALSLIGVGTTANDGTGDPLRTAFQTVNTALTAVNNAVVVGTGVTTFKDDSGTYGVKVASNGDVTFTNASGTANTGWDASAVTDTGGFGFGTVTPNTRVHIEGSISTAAVATEDVLTLGRGFNSGISFPQSAIFSIGKYAAVVAPSTQLNLRLKKANGNDYTALINVMSWFDTGSVQLYNSGATVGFAWDGTVGSNAGGLGLRTGTPTAALDVNSDLFRVRTAKTPATAGATGNTGDICWDASYIYVCTATNTWKRVAIATW